MHVDGLRGIQVQLDNTCAIIVGLYVLQQHKGAYDTGEHRCVGVQYSRLPRDRNTCMPLCILNS